MHAEAQRQHPEETPEQIEKRVAYRVKHLKRRKRMAAVRRYFPDGTKVVLAILALLIALHLALAFSGILK